ncbi:DUF1003 domain-containing protein [Streptomyces sp. NPDC007971]|uniref:DUF1003 domain-containing protein n=1 Tax=Streptomyces sp. NPDC007971 TaxID=3364799 RepID=UPI0036E6FF41
MSGAVSGPGRPGRRGGPALRLLREQDVLAQLHGTEDKIADAITAFAGTMLFVYLHGLWFTVWIVCKEGVFGQEAVWDPFPFGLLTMIVSLEAIFLSTFVMVSQNRQAARENVRADWTSRPTCARRCGRSTWAAPWGSTPRRSSTGCRNSLRRTAPG